MSEKTLYTIKKAADLSGVSVRTLQYYDKIDLLKPYRITEKGYRMYSMYELKILQEILFYKELDFPLEKIKVLLNAPSEDQLLRFELQKELLVAKKKRLEKMIRWMDQLLEGGSPMNFEAFDMTEIESIKKKYEKEVKEKWGNEDAYNQSQKKTSKYGKEDWEAIQDEYEAIIRAFSEKVDAKPSSPEVQDLVSQWRTHITNHFYECTIEIFQGLAQMYIYDERFKKSLDKYQQGTAELMSEGILEYCKNN